MSRSEDLSKDLPEAADEARPPSSLTRRRLVVGGAALGLGAAVGVVAMRGKSGVPGATPFSLAGLGARSRSVPATSSLATREGYDAAEATYLRAQAGRQGSAVSTGTLAWGESRVRQSYLTMYEATRDRIYLDKFVSASEAVLAARDDRTDVVDYRGQSLPAWSAADPYTVMSINLDGADGRPALRLSSTGVSPGATVDVRQRDPGLFDLAVTDSTRQGETVEGLSLDPSHPRYVVSTLAQRYPGPAGLTASDLRRGLSRSGLLASRTGASLVAPRYVFAVHTGMICAPFAQFAAMLVREPDLGRRFGRPAAELLQAAEAAVHVHDADWRQISPQAGLYAFAVGAPVLADGTELPHNQYLVMARCQAQLFLATRDPGYGLRARQMLNLFRSDLGTDTAPTWSYYWTGSAVYKGYEAGGTASVYSPRMRATHAAEDASHGALDVDAVVAGFDAGLGVPRALLTRLTSTLLTRILCLGPDGRWTTRARFGSADDLPATDLAAARWIELARWDRSVYTAISALLKQVRPPFTNALTLPVVAQLVRLS